MDRSYVKPSKPSAADLLPQPLRHHHIRHGLHGGCHALNAHRPLEDLLPARVFCRETAEELIEKAASRGFHAREIKDQRLAVHGGEQALDLSAQQLGGLAAAGVKALGDDIEAHRLREVHGLVSQAAGRLADPSAQDLLSELEQRLHWGGITTAEQAPVRAFANRSIVSAAFVSPYSLATERQAERLETAIVERRRVEPERYASVAGFADSPSGSFRTWPLQLLFHNIGWNLVFEEDNLGREAGLIRCERLDRLALHRSESGYCRSEELHTHALARLETLLHLSGGIYFGSDLEAQLQLCSPTARVRAKAMTTLRFCCQSWSFAFIREGLQRYPIEHTRYSKPLVCDTWWHHPKAPHVLEPGSPADTHPYPVEIDLPIWTVARDVDLRNWLFGLGAGIRVEAPVELRAEHQEWLSRSLEVYRNGSA